MTTRTIDGWLFDVDELGTHVALWVYTNDGQLVKLSEEFQPPFCVTGEREALKQLTAQLYRRGWVTGGRWVERTEFWSGQTMEALQLHVRDASFLAPLRTFAATQDRQFQFFNLDIPVAQHYLSQRQLFPLGQLTGQIDERGNVLEITDTDSRWEVAYEPPKLKVMRLSGAAMRPLNPESRVLLECGDVQQTLWLKDGAATITAFNQFLATHNPDVILSERGDTVLFPALLQLAKQTKTPLQPDRDQVLTTRKIETEGRTYFSYGRVIYKGPNYPLFGRWHIDGANSFTQHETGLAGVLELARLARIPVQRLARTSPGTAMSAITLDLALQQNILVPWRKNEPEAYKTALELLTVDKGGLTYQAKLGAFENVAEIDFASMYPSLMVKHNLSPETVLCRCCQNNQVPEANYNVCEKRRGLMSIALEPLIERRRQYKLLMKKCEAKERAIYDARRTAIKWMLVSCFGYLGYKNARFGRIEAHEAVTAWGRETLLQAKTLAESYGYKVLHALTDSLWIRKAGMTEDELQLLCARITMATKIEMTLEGIYRWIEFLPSKVNAHRPVACRYFGMFTNGEMKLRGLACRRSDTPEFIKEVQQEMLTLLQGATTLAERAALRPQLETLLQERIAQLETGDIEPSHLLVRQVLSRDPDEYAVTTRAALAAEQYRAADVPVHPGERLSYVLRNVKAKDKAARVILNVATKTDYDVQEYVRLLRVAAAEILPQDSNFHQPREKAEA